MLSKSTSKYSASAKCFDVLDLVSVIYDYLDIRSQIYFLCINKYIYKYAKDFRCVHLNQSASLCYYLEASFRNQISCLVSYPSRQVMLNLIACKGISNVSALGGVHTLDLNDCYRISDVSS